MDEDRLSPQMGRLIDRAKAAAAHAGSRIPCAEGVALLSGDGSIHVGEATATAAPPASAAGLALASAQVAGSSEILAAAVAVATDPAGSMLVSEGSRAVLAGIDADLPMVVKLRGRWVLHLLSQLPEPA